MGQTGSRVVSKIANSFSFSGSAEDDPDCGGGTLARFKGGTPLVYTRRG